MLHSAIPPAASALESGGWLLRVGLGALLGALIAWGVAWRGLSRNREVREGRGAEGGGPSDSSAARWSSRDRWLLAGALLLAAGLRIPGLDRGLWYDEITTLVEFVRLPVSGLLSTYTSLNNHILYSLLAHGSIALFGEHVWSLRLPAALFGVAGVGAVWLVGRRIGSRAEALFAALLVSTSYHHVWFSQDARGYTGLMFFALLGTWLLLRAMRRGSPGLWLGYAFVLALAMYIHLSAVFIFASHGLIWGTLWLRGQRAPGSIYPGAASLWPLAGFALGGLLVFDLHALLLPQIVAEFAAKAGIESAEVGVAEWKSPLWTFLEIVRGLHAGSASWAGWGGLVGAGALGIVGLGDFARRDRVALSLVILPPVLTLVCLLALGFHLWPRYGVVSLGFAALTVARGAFVAGSWLARSLAWPPAASRGMIAGLAVVASLASVGANYRLPKQDFEGARDWLEATRVPGERVLTAGLAIFPYRELYAPAWIPVESAADLDRALARSYASNDPNDAYGSWLVYFSPAHLSAIYPDLWQRIQRDYPIAREFPGTLGGGTIYVCHAGSVVAAPWEEARLR